MKANQTVFPIRLMCAVLGVSASGYYAWRTWGPSRRAEANALLLEDIRRFHRASRETYGVLNIREDLRELGRRINHKRIARIEVASEGLRRFEGKKGD